MFEKGFFIRPFSLFIFTWVLAFLAAPEVLFSLLETSWALGWAGKKKQQLHFLPPFRFLAVSSASHPLDNALDQCFLFLQEKTSSRSFTSRRYLLILLTFLAHPFQKAKRTSKFSHTTSSCALLSSKIIQAITKKYDLKNLKRYRLKNASSLTISFFQHLANYDIIALQEIFALGNSRQRKMINMAARHGFYYHTRSCPPPLFSPKFIDGGLLILSKYPIVETDAHIYSAGK